MIILVPVVNNPDFIEIQYATLKKYMKTPYEYVVFNDAKDFPDYTNGGDVSIRQKIRDTCTRLGVACVDIPNAYHEQLKNLSVRAEKSFNFILEFMKKYPQRYLILDSDMFLIAPLGEEDYSEFNAALVLQKRDNIVYFWNGICYLDMTRIKDQDLLNWDQIPGTDTGGSMYTWLKKYTPSGIPDTDDLRYGKTQHNSDGIYWIKHLWSCSWDASELPTVFSADEQLKSFFKNDPRNKDGKYFCEIYDSRFLHYRAGGNWNGEGMELHRRLSAELKRVLVE
jgi:hypothetical protein